MRNTIKFEKVIFSCCNFFSLSIFTASVPNSHPCTYTVWRTITFRDVGTITVTDVPDNFACYDSQLMADITAYINKP